MFCIFEGSEDHPMYKSLPSQKSKPERAIGDKSGDEQKRKSKGPSVRRNASACDSCRKRKIRCSGGQPCTACEWYEKGHLCHYALPQPTWRQVAKLSTELDYHRIIFRKLFPNSTPERIVDLSRDALVHILNNEQPTSSLRSPSSDSSQTDTEVFPVSTPPHNNLEVLEYIPEEDPDDNPLDAPDIRPKISDDVNALSSLTNKPSTFQGITSLYAAVNVILHIDPRLGSRSRQLAQCLDMEDLTTNPPLDRSTTCWKNNPLPPTELGTRSLTGAELIDVYFATFHHIAPLIDEATFRKTYLSCHRTDARWMGLLNTIFALGSLALSKANDLSHFTYYRRAMSYLNLASLGDHHVETIQTLGLIGGFYLHYLNQPNMANSLMGAALRMAASLGLYRNFEGLPGQNAGCISLELRRRIWWSLFCLDTWACMSLGRPAFGRWGRAISVQLPQGSLEDEAPDTVLPLARSISFCRIATEIQEALAASPLLPHSELKNLDNRLLKWYDDIDPIFKSDEPTSYAITFTRTLMRWKFQNQRMLLHRPILLNYALRKIPYEELTPEDRQALEICGSVAKEAIQDISSCEITNNVICGNGTWYLFQAAMTPLLGLFLRESSVGDLEKKRESCREQVEMALSTLTRMQEWGVTASRARDLLHQVLAATDCAVAENEEDLLQKCQSSCSVVDHELSNPELSAAFSAPQGEELPDAHDITKNAMWNLVSQTERDLSSEIIGANFSNFDISFFDGHDFGFDNCFPVLM